MSVKKAAKANPVTTTSGIGAVLVIVGKALGISDEAVAQIASAVIAASLAVRALVAWYDARHPADPPA